MALYIFLRIVESFVCRLEQFRVRLDSWRSSRGMVIQCEVCGKRSAARGDVSIFEADYKGPEESDLEYITLYMGWSGLIDMWAIDCYSWIWFCSSGCEKKWLSEPKTIKHIPD